MTTHNIKYKPLRMRWLRTHIVSKPAFSSVDSNALREPQHFIFEARYRQVKKTENGN